MVNALSDVEGNILDCKKAIEGFDNELLQLHWDVFDRIQGQFKDLDSELSNLRGLFDDSKVTDENFNWSKEGIAQLGLLAQQYELAQYQVQKYNDELNQLSSDYLAGRYSATEYADRLSELSSAQWDAVNASESIKDAIIDLNKVRVDEEIDAIEKEIDAYRDLVNAQIDALKSAKDLHDYQERIAEKSKAITDLERQIAAMRNDTTAATVAKRKQLEEQLAEAKKELEREQYEHSITEQENALNKEYENYENERNAEIEKLKASLEEREALIAASFETVKQNADIVGQEIALIATQHGITISDAIISSWQNGETAIADYGAVLSESTSAFIGNLMGVEYEVYNLQAQANETANSLAWMFATRADTLVGELAASYYSEQNLNAMTQALHDSLINTLEGGYNISSIMNALDGIAGGLNGVASAANKAANAIAAVGAAQAGTGSGNPYSGSSGKKTLYKLEGVAGGTITSYNKSDLEKLSESYGKGKVVPAYASGTKNAKGGLRVVNEEGAELTLPKLPSGNYAVGSEGDQILTREQTDNVYEWAKTNPEEYAEKEEKRLNKEKREALIKLAESVGGGLDENGDIVFSWGKEGKPGLIKNNSDLPIQHTAIDAINPGALDQSLWNLGSLAKHPEIAKANAMNNNVNVHYDSLVTINGDVNDTKHFLNDMKTVAQDAIKKSWKDANMTLKYGIY